MNQYRRLAVAGVLSSCFWWGPVSVGQDESPAANDPAPTGAPTARGEQGQKPAAATDNPAPPASGEKTDRATIRGPAAHPRSVRPNWPLPVICEPTQGRPIFITPGETFYFVMRLQPEVNGEVGFALRHAQEPNIRVPLKPTTPPSYVGEYCNLVLETPAGAQPGLYDLEVRAGTTSHFARHSVKVVDAFKTRFRFVHLSNMNIGDLTAPDFDEMLPKEINLLAPEFIIATGDYTEWARARDDAASWARVLKFFEQFTAPVFMLCGVHDHEASFGDLVGKKMAATIDYGGYHGLLLLDHPGNPIDQDYAQLEWIEADLKKNRDKTFNFLVANSDEMALLDIWRERGDIEKYIKDHRVKMFIAGGSTDWDYKEFANKLDGLKDLHFIRTHQASTSLRDRATGFSHYRVIAVNGDQVSYVYANDNATERLQHSVPTGRLRAFYDEANDGTASRITATVQNALNQKFDEARVWLRVRKDQNGAKPAVAPGRLIRTLDAGTHWACEVAVDLPDKGAVRVVASARPSDVPNPEPITVELDGATDWAFASRTTDFGLDYFSSSTPVTLKLINQSSVPQTCWPVIRVNGGQLQPDRAACPRLPLTIEPGKTITVPLVLNLRRVSPGPHALQVYFLEDPLNRLHTFDVQLSYEAQAAGDADAAP